jgi:hypothetical protein
MNRASVSAVTALELLHLPDKRSRVGKGGFAFVGAAG